MDSLTTTILRCNLKLTLDYPTEGFGNCFPNAIVQQCRRPEVKAWLLKNMPGAIFTSSQNLRLKVKNFALNSQEQAVLNIRKRYEEDIGPVDKQSWKEYWAQMGRNGTWVDHIFIQMTAWFMKLDMMILTTSSRPENPFIHLSGNLRTIPENTSGPPLLLGNYTNVHYQSLLEDNEEKQQGMENNDTKTEEFIFTEDRMTLIFKSSPRGQLKCPFCNQEFTRIGKHIDTKGCKIHQLQIDKKLFKMKLGAFREGYRLERKRKRNQKSRTKLRMEKGPEVTKAEMRKQKSKSRDKLRKVIDPEVMKAGMRKQKSKSRDKLRKVIDPDIIKAEMRAQKVKSRNRLIVERGPVQLRTQQNLWEKQSRKRKIEIDPEKAKSEERKKMTLSRKKIRQNNPQKFREDQQKWQQKHRFIDSEKKRLKRFKERTMLNAIFICSCCHRNLFDCNVCKLESKIIADIETKKPGLFKRAISHQIDIDINGIKSAYICLACKKHLTSGKLPPMATNNGLKVYQHNQDEELTELEGNLIAKRIVFMKIFQLPKSRWTALKDKIINIPVKEDDIVNTMTSLPRTPDEAGLIEVDLKRKVEYKNSHIKQLINPKKCYRMLELLKRKGNPYYQFYDDYNTYTERCKKADFKGYTFIFDDESEAIEDLSDKKDIDIESMVEEELLEKEYQTKDPVKKFQFEDYNKSLCMSNLYPEMDPGNSIIVAPGEGKIPQNILHDDDWDILAFPHLNSPDGRYGLHHQRETKLQDQYYFIQRICNMNPKFARSPAYVYAAVAHTELKQIQRNINISYSRGKETNNSEGVKTLKLDDPFAVLDDIKQTPRYWKKAKYEIFAKLDNFGPFQFFFTLSCADLRWPENFAAILRLKGFTLKYITEEDKDGFPKTEVYVEHHKDGVLQCNPLKKFLDEQQDESLHEFIRGNVLLATRYFNHRVKAFITNIMMGGGNPMMVEFYAYKTEFQDRGAGHIHGVLWIKLHKIEKLCRLEDGSLVLMTENEKEEMNGEFKQPFNGIKSAFKKFRTGQAITDDEETAMINFIDQFVSVSTNPDEVGAEVAKIAEEVNKHHHTKTCKPQPKCRFRFPKFPIWRTILVKPYDTTFKEEKAYYMKKYEEILEKVQELLNDEELINSIMNQFDKKAETKEEYRVNRKKRIIQLLYIAEISEEDYLEALSWSRAGYSVHLKRDLDEIYINSYNPEWLRAWDGNIDFSPTFDFFEVITYITEYFTKDESGTAEAIKQVLDNNPDNNTKEKMKKVASTFLSHRQIGEAEAFYKLLPDLNLKNSNVTCQWAPLGKKSERYIRMKRADDNENENKNLIKLEGVEGQWYEQPDILSKYRRRDDRLEKMCYSHYGRMIRSGGKMADAENWQDNGIDEEYYEDIDDTKELDNDKQDPNIKFHYIITEYNRLGEEIPQFTKLKNPMPKENPIQRKRTYPAALRFHKTNKDNNPHKFFLSELMLYIHFRDEETEFKPDNHEFIEDLYAKNLERIQNIKSKVMEHLHDVEESRHYVEEVNRKLDLTSVAINLDAAAEQENAECQEELEELHPDFLHLEPHENYEEIEKSTQQQNIYSKINLPSIHELKEKTRQLDQYQRSVIDIGIKYAKDIVKARREGNGIPEPPLLMVHGGAGSGKTHTINALADWVQYTLQTSGDELNCPFVIKTAFTGTAASLIEGMTLHSAFGFEFGNKHYSLSDKIRDYKKNILKNLKMIIIDEISMVKADMLYQLDLRLQEIKEKIGTVFGGVSIFCFGDILQLQPVCGKYIFDRPSNPSYHLTYELDPRWKKFKVLNLEINHRQGKDKEYADILNRVREAKQTEEDMDKLKEKVVPYGHSGLDEVSLYIVCKKKDCARINKQYIESLPGNEINIHAKHFLTTEKKYKPFICQKEGTIGASSFMDILKLKIGCKIILIHNIDISDRLTNGQLGILLDVVKAEDGSIVKCIVKFKNERAGHQSRQRNLQYAAKYPDGTVIEKLSFSYAISKKTSSASKKAILIQFPLKLAQAITAHKIQGQTIPKPLKVALDIKSVFDDGQAHVMLSRVQEINQLYILESLPDGKIRASAKAVAELEIMNKNAINNNPISWDQTQNSFVKISALNCMNLNNNYEDLVQDKTLLKSSILALSETWLDIDKSVQIDGYRAHFNSIGPGKGLAIYFNDERFKPVVDIKEDKLQITKIESKELEIILIYRSQQGSVLQLIKHLKAMIKIDKPTAICGDFNICYNANQNNMVTKFLENQGFKQLMKAATHIKGRNIDHFYLRTGGEIKEDAVMHRYSPYYSDHDAACVTIKRK